MFRIRKGINIITDILSAFCFCLLWVYYLVGIPSVRALVSLGLSGCVVILPLGGIGKLAFALWDRYLVKTRTFFFIEREGWQKGLYSVVLVGAQGNEMTLRHSSKEVVDAYLQKIRGEPFTYGFQVPIEGSNKEFEGCQEEA